MGIEEIIQPDAIDSAELVDTTNTNFDGAKLDDTQTDGEPLDTEEFPDTFDDEPGTVVDKKLLKLLRDRDAAQQKRIRELERGAGPATIQRYEKPDLWEDDAINGDTDKYDAALLAWKENERKADEQENAVSSEQQQVAQSWQQELQAYKTNATKLGKEDFPEAEELVISTLSAAQQTTLVMAAKDPARFIYALGRSPNRLAQLAQITNPIKLAAEVARIEGGRTMARKDPPAIDTPVRGSARLSAPEKSKEEAKMVAEAGRTGDVDKLREWRKQNKQAA